MDKISRTKWQELENEFLSGELNDEAFCRSKNLELEWFRKELAKSEARENPGKKETADRLFVELLPQLESPGASEAAGLKLKYRDVDIEFGTDLPVEYFRQVLRVIREEL